MNNTNNISKSLFLNSASRMNGSDFNNARYLIRGLENAEDDYKILLKEFTIGNDLYNINSYNNQFILGTTNNTTITMPKDNYDGTSFSNYLNTNAPILGMTGLTTSYDSSLLKTTFTNATGGNIYLKQTSDKQRYLGLTTNQLNTISNSGTLTTGKQDWAGTKALIIETNIQLESMNSDNNGQNRLDEIYITEDFTNIIKYENDYPIQTKTNNLSELQLILKDDNGDLIESENDYRAKILFLRE